MQDARSKSQDGDDEPKDSLGWKRVRCGVPFNNEFIILKNIFLWWDNVLTTSFHEHPSHPFFRVTNLQHDPLLQDDELRHALQTMWDYEGSGPYQEVTNEPDHEWGDEWNGEEGPEWEWEDVKEEPDDSYGDGVMEPEPHEPWDDSGNPRTCGMQRAHPIHHAMHPSCHRHRRQWHQRDPRNGAGGMNGRDGVSAEMAPTRNGSTTPTHGSPIGPTSGNPGRTTKHHGPPKRRPNPMAITPRVVGSPIAMVHGGRSSIQISCIQLCSFLCLLYFVVLNNTNKLYRLSLYGLCMQWVNINLQIWSSVNQFTSISIYLNQL